MSSAISTRRDVRDGRAPAIDTRPSGGADDAGFRPWHFFVLASLGAATIAVLMSRQATPAHLILISLMIGAAGAAAAAFYRTLAPLAVRDVAVFSQRQSERARIALEREKALVLRSIKELEFDRAMGKVSTRDFDEMSARLRTRAMMLIRQADEGGSGYRELIEKELTARLVGRGRGPGAATVVPGESAPAEPREAGPAASLDPLARPSAAAVGPIARQCPACGTAGDADAVFCKRCGTPIEVHA